MRVRVQVLAVALASTLAVGLQAQSPFKAGTNYIGPSVSLSSYGSSADFSGNFEHAINDKWGWGLSVGYFSYSFGDVDGYSYSVIPVAGTAAYHFDAHNEKLDPFVGGSVGIFIYSHSCPSDVPADLCSRGAQGSRPLIGGFGGVRYWTSDKLALVGRVGFGLGLLSVGVDFKM
ncbi:MAG TPA: hypothetical protein VGL65_01265 [Gemmatimonadales bacterium]|jgi:hypothetical protein